MEERHIPDKERASGGAGGADPSDLQLISAANNGDARAMEAIYFRYRDWVFAQAMRIVSNHEDASDVLQEVFLYFFRKFPGLVLNCQVKTFLYPVVRNLALNRRQKRTAAPLGDRADEIAARPDSDPAGQRADMAGLLDSLSDEHREVVLLRFADGLSFDEIAQALSIPLGTVKSRLHNALTQLRGRLSR
ncbi:MAG: sigma-70 family RNA polymerase sigma factor [Planctomycetes bacterium]|nr:sigma-70 family RNA polymerase sigma factor [Planctomycetota bacterium]